MTSDNSNTTWEEFLAVVKVGNRLAYKAPLSYFPGMVRVVAINEGKVLCKPSDPECDSFWADSGHLYRFINGPRSL